MSLFSIRLNNQLINETKERAKILNMSESKYIRIAIEHMNKEVLRQKFNQKLKKSSLLVRKESQLVNDEFSRIEHDPEA